MTGSSNGNRARITALLASTILSPFVLAAAAHAQAPAAQSSDKATSAEPAVVEEVVVTGTLLRGVAPAGANTVGINEQAIKATGAASSAQLLASVPQVAASFNTRPNANGTIAAQATNRINLRALPGSTGGGSSTLILLDGHRLPGMGIQQTIPDPDAIAPGSVQRVEIVTDGGSSTYGADAVGGVVNFITRRRFDGVEASARYGVADNFHTTDLGLTAGHSWNAVSAYLSYNYSSQDALFGRDRDFVRRWDYVKNLPLELSCTPGNVIIGAATYALPGLVAGNGNRCDSSQDGSIIPEQRRHSLFGAIAVDIAPWAKFDVKGFYTNRKSEGYAAAPTASVSVSPTNPFYRSVGGANAAATQTVQFNFAPISGPSLKSENQLESWQVAPSLTFDVGSDWQIRTLASFGRGVNQSFSPGLDPALLSAAVQSGQFNPYDVTAPGNTALMPALYDNAEQGKGVNDLLNARVIADGKLFSLPGGQVRVAMGAEFIEERYYIRYGVGKISTGQGLQTGKADRNTNALFGEVQVPVVGEGNRVAGLYELNVSASGRYDHYSDFGGTFNPKFGLTYAPTSWMRLRGTWGKSFQAPSLADRADAAGSSIIAFPFVVFPAPGVTPLPGQAQIFLSGGGVDLRPQKAKTWNAGFEIEPPGIANLRLTANYYHINFTDLISIPPVFVPTTFYPLFKDSYVLAPTIAQVNAFAAGVSGGPAAVAPYTQREGQVYVIVDGRRQNLAFAMTDGIDLGVNYTHPTSFGSVYANLNGNYILRLKQAAKAGAPVSDYTDTEPTVRIATTVGAVIGDLRAQATVNTRNGYDVTPTALNANQSRVKRYTLVNLFFQYDLNRTGLLSDSAITLNVDNLLDEDPSQLRSGTGYAAGNPLGRYIQIGLRKTF